MKFMAKVILFSMALFAATAAFSTTTGRAVGDWREGSAPKIDWSNPSPEDQAFGAAMGTSVLCFPFAAFGLIALAVGFLKVMVSPKTREESNIALGMGETGFGTRMWGTRAQERPGARSEKPKHSVFDFVWNRRFAGDVDVALKELKRGTSFDYLLREYADIDPSWPDAVREAKRLLDKGTQAPWKGHVWNQPTLADHGPAPTAQGQKHATLVRSQNLTNREKAYLEIAMLSVPSYDVVRVTLKAQGATPKEIDRVWNCL